MKELRGDLATLRVDMDQVKSMDIKMLWSDESLPEVPAIIPPTEFGVDVPLVIVG